MKLLRYIILFCLLFVLVSCNDEVTPQHTFPDAEYAVNATDMAVVGDKIYYISGEKVYETALDTPVFEDFPVSHIAAAGDALAMFGGGQLQIGEKCYTLPESEITGLVCTGNTVGFTFRENGLQKLGFYQRKNGDSLTVQPLLPGEMRMLPFQEGRILIQCTDTTEGGSLLYDFDTETMKPGNVMLEADMITVSAYNAADNAIYMLDGNAGGEHLTRYDVETGESTTVIPADALRMNLLDLTFSGGTAIVRKLSGGISAVNEFTSAEEGVNTVKLLSMSKADGFMNNLVYILKRDHDIQLEVTTIAEDKLKVKLLAGDNDFDLYVGAMQDGGDYLTNTLILDYPVYEPLENFPQITEQTNGLFEDVVRLCRHDGHIFGIPFCFFISNTILSYDAELASELGVTLPDPDWTLADFYNLAKEVRSDGVYLSFNLPLSLWDYMHQYFDPYGSGTLNDDGTALKEYLTIYKKMYDEDLLYPGIWRDASEAVKKGEIRFLFDNAESEFIWNHKDVILPPSFIGERIYTVNNPYLIMNPNSQNKNAAAAVIAAYLDPENRMLTKANWGSYIYKDMSVYEHSAVRPSNFEETWDNANEERRAKILADIEDSRREFMTNDLVNMDEKTAHNFELYCEILKYAKLGPSYVDEWLRFANDEAEKYFDDAQDLDYTVERILNRAKMILDE